MAHALGLRTIAEGIETTAQHEVVRAMGSCSVQDYLFAPDAGTRIGTSRREREAEPAAA